MKKTTEKTIVMEESTFLKRHAKEILIGAGIVVGVGAIALITKHNIDISKLRDENGTLMAAASEGLFEEAIATVTRKINYKTDRVEFVKQQLLATPDDIQTKQSLQRLTKELSTLVTRKEKFLKAQHVYEIALE